MGTRWQKVLKRGILIIFVCKLQASRKADQLNACSHLFPHIMGIFSQLYYLNISKEQSWKRRSLVCDTSYF